MKVFNTLLALCLSQANVWAFIAQTNHKASSGALYSSSGGVFGDAHNSNLTPNNFEVSETNLFPTYPKLDRIEGGGTIKTYQMPPWAEKCQYYITTEGRPMKGKIELWLGPLRKTHRLEFDFENGKLTPYECTLKFKKGPQVLRIQGSGSGEFPLLAGVSVCSPTRHEQLQAITEKVFYSAEQKDRIQGGATTGGMGAIRTFDIPTHVSSVQFVAWSFDVGKKSLRCKVELLQGPNNKKQSFLLQCGGGSQPHHAVLQTPGAGWQIRITNDKFVEDGLFEFAVSPYTTVPVEPEGASSFFIQG